MVVLAVGAGPQPAERGGTEGRDTNPWLRFRRSGTRDFGGRARRRLFGVGAGQPALQTDARWRSDGANEGAASVVDETLGPTSSAERGGTRPARDRVYGAV